LYRCLYDKQFPQHIAYHQSTQRSVSDPDVLLLFILHTYRFSQ